MSKAISMFLFWTYREKSDLATLTRWATDGPWSHMGHGFCLDDARSVYFEALRDEGFVGPRPLIDLHTWSKESGHHARFELVQLRPGEAEIAYQRSLKMVGAVSYSKWALCAMAVFERYGIRSPSSETKVVCSEATSRCVDGLMMSHGVELILRDFRRSRHDEVNPNSAWRRWCEIKSGCNVSVPRSEKDGISW